MMPRATLSSFISLLPRTVMVCAAAGAACLAIGCNIVGPVAIALAPEPSRDAEFDLVDRPTAVFIDDRRTALGDRPLRRYVGDKISEHLQREGVLEEHVPIRTRDTLAVAGTEKNGSLISVEEIGREVGAEQLIYVEMIRFNILTEADRPMARAELRVRVLDIVNGVQIFPGSDPEQSRSMLVDLPSEIMFKPQLTRASTREAELALCDKIALDVARIFYKHDIRPLGSRVNPEEHLR